jgi:hypothetical protein
MEWINANKKQPEDTFDVLITDGIRFGLGNYDDSINGENPWTIDDDYVKYVKYWMKISAFPED